MKNKKNKKPSLFKQFSPIYQIDQEIYALYGERNRYNANYTDKACAERKRIDAEVQRLTEKKLRYRDMGDWAWIIGGFACWMIGFSIIGFPLLGLILYFVAIVYFALLS